jgi:cytidylate kinase
VLKIASKLIARRAADAPQERGIDLEEIIKLAENPEARGTRVEIEAHKKYERVVIALESQVAALLSQPILHTRDDRAGARYARRRPRFVGGFLCAAV